jgi:plasmid maintenance system antidote protein VapI
MDVLLGVNPYVDRKSLEDYPFLDYYPRMDKPITAVEALRSKLKELPRWRVLELADVAGVPRSTVEKFRLDHITELGASKYEALQRAVDQAELKAA